MAAPHELGRRGEELAAAFLRERGWTILARNFRFGHKEIDIVARRGEVVAFIEVKTRAGFGFGHPLESITSRQRNEIARVANLWVARHGQDSDLFRFDAISIIQPPGEPPVIEHLEDAWRL